MSPHAAHDVPRRGTVVIVDDAADLRLLLETAIAQDGRLEVVAAVGDGHAAIAAVRHHHPDVVLMDVSMPVLDGVAATRLLTAEHPGLPVVLFTGYDHQVLSDTARAAGAAELVGKDLPVRRLVEKLLTHSGPPPARDEPPRHRRS